MTLSQLFETSLGRCAPWQKNSGNNNAVDIVRNPMGQTNPVSSAAGTIRGDLGIDIGRNLVHGSDSPESAEREVNLFFSPEEILSYERAVDSWINE